MEKIIKEIEELKKRVAALEGQVQAQQKIEVSIDDKKIASTIVNGSISETTIKQIINGINQLQKKQGSTMINL
jgi:cell division septum initiation protein DivIVA